MKFETPSFGHSNILSGFSYIVSATDYCIPKDYTSTSFNVHFSSREDWIGATPGPQMSLQIFTDGSIFFSKIKSFWKDQNQS